MELKWKISVPKNFHENTVFRALGGNSTFCTDKVHPVQKEQGGKTSHGQHTAVGCKEILTKSRVFLAPIAIQHTSQKKNIWKRQHFEMKGKKAISMIVHLQATQKRIVSHI